MEETMSQIIRVDDDVYQALQDRASPFVDKTPNDVLRRVLGVDNVQQRATGELRDRESRLDRDSRLDLARDKLALMNYSSSPGRDGVDLLATKNGRSASIIVRTRTGAVRNWLMTRKAESQVAKDLFYVFVNIGNGQPSFTVVPSKVVADTVRKRHER